MLSIINNKSAKVFQFLQCFIITLELPPLELPPLHPSTRPPTLVIIVFLYEDFKAMNLFTQIVNS